MSQVDGAFTNSNPPTSFDRTRCRYRVPRIQNKSGFDRKGAAATTGGLVNPSTGGRHTISRSQKAQTIRSFLIRKSAVSFIEHLQARLVKAAMQQIGQANVCMFSRQLICLSMAVLPTINFMETTTLHPPLYSNHCPQSETTSKLNVLQ